jgi:hypothetical protein
MNKNILISLFFSFSFLASISQPTIQWQKTLGGSGNDVPSFIQQTNDGGFIATGQSNSNDGDVSGNHGSDDFWVVKLNNTGTIEWQKSLGGTGDEIIFSAQQTNDGGYIVAGVSTSNDGDVSGNHGSADYWVVKLSNIGAIEWQKSLGGSGFDSANSIQQTNDGGYIVAGGSLSNDGDVSSNYGESDLWVVKLSSIGTIEWQKSLGGSVADGVNSIQQTNDGGYILSGGSSSNDVDVSGNHGLIDFWLVKLNNTGTIEWQKSFGGSANDIALSIVQTNDGGYIVTGWTSSNDGDVSGFYGGISDCWVVKLNNVGTIEWQKSLGGSGAEYASSIQQTNDGGYVIAVRSSSIDGDVTGNYGATDYWAVKLTNTGSIDWQISLGGSVNDLTSAIDQTNDGGYIVAGQSISNDGDVTGNHGSFDFWVVKLNTCQPIESNLTFNECNPFSVNGITYSNSGIYSQTLTNASGCDSTLIINAEILDFNAQIFQSDTMLYVNGSPTSIQWINCTTGQAISGETANSFNPQNSGNYAAVINVGGCVDTSNCRFLLRSIKALKPSTVCDNIQISPNPTEDLISFTLDKSDYPINLFTSAGAILYAESGNAQKQTLNIGDLAPAMYVLQVDECRYKIVKQ